MFVSSKAFEADPSKITDLIALPPPTTTKQLVTFLQKVPLLSPFYSPFGPISVKITKPGTR